MEDSVEFRRAQEAMSNILRLGYQKEMAKLHKAFFDAYIEAGFNEKQALEMTKAWVNCGISDK